jgi:hypothetical protein
MGERKIGHVKIVSCDQLDVIMLFARIILVMLVCMDLKR